MFARRFFLEGSKLVPRKVRTWPPSTKRKRNFAAPGFSPTSEACFNEIRWDGQKPRNLVEVGLLFVVVYVFFLDFFWFEPRMLDFCWCFIFHTNQQILGRFCHPKILETKEDRFEMCFIDRVPGLDVSKRAANHDPSLLLYHVLIYNPGSSNTILLTNGIEHTESSDHHRLTQVTTQTTASLTSSSALMM